MEEATKQFIREFFLGLQVGINDKIAHVYIEDMPMMSPLVKVIPLSPRGREGMFLFPSDWKPPDERRD